MTENYSRNENYRCDRCVHNGLLFNEVHNSLAYCKKGFCIMYAYETNKNCSSFEEGVYTPTLEEVEKL